MGGKALNGKRIPVEQANELFAKLVSENNLDLKSDRILLCGSARRQKKTCGDLDIVFIDRDDAVKSWLVDNFGTKKNGKPQTTCLIDGVQVEFYEASPETWGTSLLMWTGSAYNNVRLRRAAKARGLKLSQHGLFDGSVNLAAGKNEQEIFELLDEKYKEPQHR